MPNFHGYSNKKVPPTLSNLGGILQSSIMSSISTVVMIGGFVVLFSVIISILNNAKVFDLLNLMLAPVLDTFGLPHEFASRSIFWNYRAYKWSVDYS